MARKLIGNLPGFNVRPLSITQAGVVSFTTNGSDVIIPNQLQCESYGYTYDELTGTCRTFIYNNNINSNINNTSNDISGVNNRAGTATDNSLIIGENNQINGFSRNGLVLGENNQVVSDASNSLVLGSNGEVVARNSFVIGGNAPGDNLGERQFFKCIYGTQTTAGGTVDSYLNNTVDNFLFIPDNTIWFFHAYVVAVRVAGTNTGNTGDYASFVERGVAINESGTTSIKREKDDIKSNGTVTDWRPVAAVDGTRFRMTVRGETNVTVEWCITVEITQIKTGVSL